MTMVLVLMREYGSVASVLITSSRRLLTGCIALLTFHAGFSRGHASGLVLVLGGLAVKLGRMEAPRLAPAPHGGDL